jgi:release factor glutamine methyltransferase
VLGVLRAAEGYLAGRAVDAPRRSAELLIAHLLGLTRLQLYLAHDRPLSEAERARLRELVAQRGRGVPLAYLLGGCEFFGLELVLTRDVLVPRPETEGLVELAIERAPRGARCADLGTGSGAIAVALAHARDDVTVVASDVSAAAAAVAQRNVERHGLQARVEVRCGSYWEPLAPAAPFDLLVSNPPYVDRAQPELLAAEVVAHEPHAALFAAGGADAAYRAILEGARAHLRPGAWLLLETGVGIAERALALVEGAPFLEGAELRPDLAGLPRYVLARVVG